MLKLCILDAQTLGEDMNLLKFERFGEVSIYQTTTPDQVIKRISHQEIIITNKVILNEANLQYAKNAKLICATATGTNNIDFNYTRSRGIVVCNVAGYSTRSVVQHTFAMLFYILESLSYYDQYVKSGEYNDSEIFTNLNKPFIELYGKTWGIIGLGTIGQEVASIAQAFGCNIIYYSTSGKNNNKNYSRVDLNTLLSSADIISIHAPLNAQTDNLIDYQQIKLMKSQATLLNLGRGGIINEAALAKALDEKIIHGAALDVLGKEPIDRANPLLKINNKDRLLITPHIAWGSQEARARLIDEICLNIESFIKGEPRNIV